ncbi:MAG: hypothetical protein RLZZ301_1519 [Bacteroidota bacterium]|jgi:2',3'-cyclic-nucleotide 2'-phosphodiesterase (5'-nucleotidase family)
MVRIFLVCFIGASLLACSAHFRPTLSAKSLAVANLPADSTTLAFLKPYQDTLAQTFGQVIARCPEPMLVQRPSSSLMNWCADAILAQQSANLRLAEPAICLLNAGGLRSSFGQGLLTLADFYKLMPFDNRITWVHFPVSHLHLIASYLKKSGGEPLSGCLFENDQLQISGLTDHDSIWIITSDFLANGGDNMLFFKGLEKKETNTLLRDVFIEVAKMQQELQVSNQVRVKL